MITRVPPERGRPHYRFDLPFGFRIGVGARFINRPNRWIDRWICFTRYRKGRRYIAWHVRLAWFYFGRQFAESRPWMWDDED